ncbi:MAG: S9 family peptidase [Bacteroidetes bacterium]|nr:MAG: S9 family peptidase [Bacteroidota bacterium]
MRFFEAEAPPAALVFRSAACFLLGLLCLPAGFAQPSRDPGKISLERIWLYYEFYPRSPSEFRWMHDDRYYSVLEAGEGIDRYQVEAEAKEDRLLDFNELALEGVDPGDIDSYDFSADESRVLLKAQTQPIYRHSSKEICLVATRGEQTVTVLHGGAKITNATFSPDGSKVAYVFENNLYYTDLATATEVQVTQDGELNAIINGLTDWVYEEEFAFVDAFKWSPDGQRIAYYRFDEREVPEFSMDLFGSLYPRQQVFRYPKAGETNSTVTLHIYDLPARKTVMVDVGEETDQYIPRIRWTQSPDRLAIMRLNRLQNHLDILIADAATGATEVYLTETSETYLREATDDMWYFMANGDFLWLSERSGYYHLYRYDAEGELVKALTKGEWAIDEIVGVDEENGFIYYTSTEVSPLERHLYRINLMGKKKKRLTPAEGTHSITASTSFRYFVDRYSTTTQVPVSQLCDAEGRTLKVLEDNKSLASRVNKLDIAAPEFFDFETREGVSLNGWMIKPQDFDPAKQYPVLMFVYGGPGSQEVLNAWGHGDAFNYMWFQMLAQQGYIVACVDNRGTGGRGRDFRASTYADLGNLETKDQIEAAHWLGRQSYVDADRIGIWGWSYGGYMTALALTKGGGLFKAGIAVAPVTNWRFYDTIYTERYLKTPQLNPDGYDENSPLNFAGDLQGSLLLVHGTGDDNVHVQNSYELVDALVASSKQFEMFFYPNRNHGIYGGTTRYHLYQKMTNFLMNNL